MSGRLLLRYWYPNGGLQAALPLHAVEVSPARTVGWLLAGSEISYWSTADGRDPRSIPLAQRFHQELTTAPRRWEGADVLRVLPAGRPYQVLHFFDRGTFLGWYINFESPARWNEGVADTRDWHLDLTISPDGQGAWKDEDEAAVAVECGHLHAHELELAQDEGDGILADFEAFLADIGDWRSARPGPDIGPIPLPAGWNSLGPSAI